MQVSSRKRRVDRKIPQLCDYLRALALELGPNAKLPAVVELCATLETSGATITACLDVLEEQQVIYRKSGRGIYVSPSLFRHTVGILFAPHLSKLGTSPFWGMLLGHLADLAAQRFETHGEDHRFFMNTPPANQETILSDEVRHLVETKQLQGVLGIILSQADIVWIRSQNIPCVTFGCYSPWAVDLDYQDLIRQAIEDLTQRGCRSVGLWTADTHPWLEGQQVAFEAALSSVGLVFDPSLIKAPIKPVLTDQDRGREFALDLLATPRKQWPDGLVLLNDLMAEGALATLLAHGIRIGEEIQIVTHANTGSMLLFDYLPGVHVLEFDLTEIAQHLFKLLNPLLAGDHPAPVHVALKPRMRTTFQT